MPRRLGGAAFAAHARSGASDVTRDPARLVLVLVLAYFALRILYLASHVSPALPPDEIDHFGLSRHAAAYWSWPQDTPASHPHGVIGDRPPLYYWTMGRVLDLRPTALAELVGVSISELVWLRLANGLLALGTVLAGLVWLRQVGASLPAQVLFAVLLTNLPMWSFLSATVNYDNLATLLAAVAFAALARYVDTRSPGSLWLLLAALGGGALTKLAFLPFAALMLVALVLCTGSSAARDLLATRWPLAPRTLALAIGAVLLCGASAALYGGNLLHYGVLSPAPNQVLPLEDAKRNRIFAQQYVLRSYRGGAIDYRSAAAELQRIEHEGDRAGALWMLQRARELREADEPPLRGRLSYAGAWIGLVGERIVGVMGHRELYKGPALSAGYGLFAAGGLAALAVCARRRRPGAPPPRHLAVAMGVFVAYALVVMQLVNYPIYRTVGLEVEAVQGRYLFPALIPLIAAAAGCALTVLPARFHWAAVATAAAFFVAFDFPYFLVCADAAWFTPAP